MDHAQTKESRRRDTTRSDLVRNRLLAALLALLVIAGLKWSYPVTMPIGAAAFLIAAAWPIKAKLDRATPPAFAYVFTLIVLFAIFAAFGAGTWLVAERAAEVLTERREAIRETLGAGADWLARQGLPSFDGERGFDLLVGWGRAALSMAYAAVGYLGLIALLVILGLPEAHAFGQRLRNRLHAASDRRATFEALAEIGEKFRSYVGVTMVTSALSGLGTWLFAWAMGLELAVVWGGLNFLMNFVPVVGTILGVAPPTLYAFVQFDDLATPLLIGGGLSVILVAISNFVYPMLQGRGMRLPAVTIIVALSFWGWVWGLAGALLAVPLTAAFVIACGSFRDTRWIADLLSRGE